MLEWRYLVLVQIGVVFAPLLGAGIELVGLIGAPPKPNDSLQLCLSLLRYLDFLQLIGLGLQHFLQFLLADEVADTSSKIPHRL